MKKRKERYEDLITTIGAGLIIDGHVYYAFQLKNPKIKYWLNEWDFSMEED